MSYLFDSILSLLLNIRIHPAIFRENKHHLLLLVRHHIKEAIMTSSQ